MGLSFRRFVRRKIEEIEFKGVNLKEVGGEHYIMTIKGQMSAVMAVAQRMVDSGQLLAYWRHSAYETKLLFPPGAFRNVEPMAVFQQIRDAAWKHIDPRGQK